MEDHGMSSSSADIRGWSSSRADHRSSRRTLSKTHEAPIAIAGVHRYHGSAGDPQSSASTRMKCLWWARAPDFLMLAASSRETMSIAIEDSIFAQVVSLIRYTSQMPRSGIVTLILTKTLCHWCCCWG